MAFILDDLIGGIVRHQQLMKQRARPRFETTAYGSELRGMGEKGTIDVAGRVGRYAGDVYGQAARSTAATRGRLYAQGMGGSMAGQRALNEPGMQAAGMVAGERSRLEEANEQIRQAARERYAQLSTEWNEQRRREQQEIDAARRENIYGSLAGAAGSAVNLGVGAITGGLSGGLTGAGIGALKAGLTGGQSNIAALEKLSPEYKQQQRLGNQKYNLGIAEQTQQLRLLQQREGILQNEEARNALENLDDKKRQAFLLDLQTAKTEDEYDDKIWSFLKAMGVNPYGK